MKNNDTKSKSFKDLIDEVQEPGRCRRCGGCVALCSSMRVNALEIGPDGGPRYRDETACLSCGLCYAICPEVAELDGELETRFGSIHPLEKAKKITSAQVNDPKILNRCTDGGVVTGLLTYMFDKGFIDGAVTSTGKDVLSRTVSIVASHDEIVASAGSHFSNLPHLEEVGARYLTYTPTFSGIKGLNEKNFKRLALVGTPCQITTFRKMQLMNLIPSDKIVYSLGLFCMESFYLKELLEHSIRKDDFSKIIKINVKEDFVVTYDDGRKTHIPFSVLDMFARTACLYCPDFSNLYADISFGGVGSEDEYTTAVIRTPEGAKIWNGAVREGYISEWQAGSNTERQKKREVLKGKILSMIERKKERAQKKREFSRKT